MTTKYISFLAATFLSLVATTTQAQVKKAEIMATGLTCSLCSNAINKQLEAMPTVANVETDLNTNTFVITFKDDNFVEPVVLKDAVEKAGFFVGSMVVTMNLNSDMIKSENSFVINNNTFNLIDKKSVRAGESKFKIANKGFVTQKEYKKLAKSNAKNESYLANEKQVYHLQTIL
nr:heavy metal-associated domain-containing protein [uncultured Flavobacterium sp.]